MQTFGNSKQKKQAAPWEYLRNSLSFSEQELRQGNGQTHSGKLILCRPSLKEKCIITTKKLTNVQLKTDSSTLTIDPLTLSEYKR